MPICPILSSSRWRLVHLLRFVAGPKFQEGRPRSTTEGRWSLDANWLNLIRFLMRLGTILSGSRCWLVQFYPILDADWSFFFRFSMLIGPLVSVRRRTKFPREAVHDGENMRLLAEGASKQVQMVSNGAAGCVFFGRGRGWRGCTHFMHGRSRMTMDLRITTMPRRARRSCTDQAGIACTKGGGGSRDVSPPSFEWGLGSFLDGWSWTLVPGTIFAFFFFKYCTRLQEVLPDTV